MQRLKKLLEDAMNWCYILFAAELVTMDLYMCDQSEVHVGQDE